MLLTFSISSVCLKVGGYVNLSEILRGLKKG